MFYCTFYFFKIVLCAVNLSMIKKSSWKHDCDNNHELEPVGLPKNGVLQVLSSWENQTILKCLKHHRKNCFTFNIFWELKMESFGEATSKEICFFLCLEKRKNLYTIILAIRFHYDSKKELLSVEFLLPWLKAW